MIRDEELNRLIRYAQGMGLSVRFKPYKKYSRVAAEWHPDGTQITIYTQKSDSKLDVILSLIHEIGHHKGFIENQRVQDPKVDEALNAEEISKRFRKRIYNMEFADSLHWDQIYKDTNCQFNLDKLHKQREFDIWQYEVYHELDRLPTYQESRVKWRELKKKWKC